MIDASNKVAELYGKGEYCSRCIHRWAKICLEGKHISLSLSGKFSSKSFLHDELVSLQVSSYLHSKKFKVSPMLVKKYFEEHILPVLHIEVPFTISVRTAACWMNKLGFYYKQYKKGIYFDGHNCEDVCKIRTLPTLELGEKEHVWIIHDESTFHTYNGPCAVWGPQEEQPLRKKGLSQGIHVSGFLTETIGPLKDDTGEARVTMVLGANRDGYWNGGKTHPGFIGIWAFDNATSHTAYASNALLASKMNKGPGGSVLKTRDTIWDGQRQSMVIEHDFFVLDKKPNKSINLLGEPKGIEWVLKERGLWQENMVLDCQACSKKEPNPDNIGCCARRLIANQPDFLAQKGLIQQEIESRGHK
ncbi:12972_t:CDS:2, partial [Entrophospora sp. SA101]